MKTLTRIAATMTILVAAVIASVANGASIADSIANSSRADGNTERDGARHPDQVLAFIGSGSGDTVLDWGAGGGYWSELFSGVVGEEGRVYAHQNAGERFESNTKRASRSISRTDPVTCSNSTSLRGMDGASSRPSWTPIRPTCRFLTSIAPPFHTGKSS